MRLPSLSRVRLLPATLTVAAIVLPLKLASIWQALTVPGSEPVIAEAMARETKGEPKAGAAAPLAAQPEPKAPTKPEAPSGGDRVLPGDKIPLTQTEIDLLQKLQARREALDARERELDMREGLLRAAEQSLQAKAGELTQLQSKIETLIGKQSESQEKKLETLVAIYEKMKPKDAARIFNEMEMDLLASVMGGMKEGKIAPILAELDPAKARGLTARLAEKQPPVKLAQ